MSEDETTESGEKEPEEGASGKPLPEVKNDFREMLGLADLPEYERKVLSTLVFEGRMEAKAVAQKSGVPRSKVYDVLDSLTGQGLVFCEDESARPKEFRAARPEIIVGNLTRDLQRIQTLNETMRAELTELYEAGLEGANEEEASDYVAFQEKEAAIASEIFGVLNQANDLRAIGQDFSWIQGFPRIRETIEDLASRGGEVKLLSNRESRSEELSSLASKLEGTGVELRMAGDLESQAMIVDGEIVLLAVRKRNPKATGPDYILARLRSEELASDLLNQFKSSWMEAEPMVG